MLTEKKKIVNIPTHVAIIPDGNRRWAKEKGLLPWNGHEAGAKKLEELFLFALEAGVECLSFWGSSKDNMTKRPLNERLALLRIYKEYFAKLARAEEIHKNQVKISIVGRWEELFPGDLKKVLYDLMRQTEKYNQKKLNFLLAYNGDDEMIEAVNLINQKYCGQKITAKILKAHLMTKDLPPLDLVIRTGGEPHLSAGFMMWDAANAQLYFSEKYFPDFGREEFAEALEDYNRRKRRLGK
jgi:undecaprenyl diphosphate synthase